MKISKKICLLTSFVSSIGIAKNASAWKVNCTPQQSGDSTFELTMAGTTLNGIAIINPLRVAIPLAKFSIPGCRTHSVCRINVPNATGSTDIEFRYKEFDLSLRMESHTIISSGSCFAGGYAAKRTFYSNFDCTFQKD